MTISSFRHFALMNAASYSQNDPLKVTVGLENSGSAPIIIHARLWPTHYKQYFDKFDILLQVEGDRPNSVIILPVLDKRLTIPLEENFVTLQPQRRISSVIDVKRFFGLPDAGKYTLSTVYHNSYEGKEFNLSAWTGTLVADPMQFSIE